MYFLLFSISRNYFLAFRVGTHNNFPKTGKIQFKRKKIKLQNLCTSKTKCSKNFWSIQFLFVCCFYFSVSAKLCPKTSQKFSLLWIISEMFCRLKSVCQPVKNTLCQNVFQLVFYTRISIFLFICSLIHFLWKKEDFNHKIKALSQLLPSEKKKAKIVEFLDVLKTSIFFHTSNENIEYLFENFS